MSKQRVHKSTFSNYTVAKKSSPLVQTRPLINPHQQRNAENAQKPASTVKPQTAEEWKKDNVFLKAIETLEAQQQQEIQAKLTVGEPGDKYEQEADAMASKVLSMSDATVQKQSEEKVQTKPLARNITPVVQRAATRTRGSVQANGNLESRLNSSRGGGSPLPNQVRSFMEPRFGADFSRVRVHTDTTAVQMNRDLGAQAFTHGSDIYYGAGKAPGNNELTAHELTHVVQQTGGVRSESKLETQPMPDRAMQDQVLAEKKLVQTKCEECEKEESIQQLPNENNQVQADSNPTTQQPQQQAAPAQHSSLQQFLNECQNAGLLEPPFRPADVPPIAAFPGSQNQSNAQRNSVVTAAGMAASAAPAYSPQPNNPTTPAPNQRPWTPRVIEGGRGLAVPETTQAANSGRGLLSGAGRLLGVAGLRLLGVAGLLLDPTPTAAPWRDELNQITGRPYSSPQEYEWARQLTPNQIQYLRRLWMSHNLQPESQMQSEQVPQPVPTLSRRNPNQTCEDSVLDDLQKKMHDVCDKIPGESCSPSKVSPKKLAKRPCSKIRERIRAVQECIRLRKLIQDQCFGGIPDQAHTDAIEQLKSGLQHCLALEKVNCQPGHPMADK